VGMAPTMMYCVLVFSAAAIGSWQCCALWTGVQGVTLWAHAAWFPLQADTYITAFRRWLASYGGGGPFGDVTQPHYLEQIGARQSREQLLDRCVCGGGGVPVYGVHGGQE
jgi:hypothetical protein